MSKLEPIEPGRGPAPYAQPVVVMVWLYAPVCAQCLADELEAAITNHFNAYRGRPPWGQVIQSIELAYPDESPVAPHHDQPPTEKTQ